MGPLVYIDKPHFKIGAKIAPIPFRVSSVPGMEDDELGPASSDRAEDGSGGGWMI